MTESSPRWLCWFLLRLSICLNCSIIKMWNKKSLQAGLWFIPPLVLVLVPEMHFGHLGDFLWGVVKVIVMSDSLCPMDCSLPGSSAHGILQARVLEWVSIPFSKGSSWSRDRTKVSCIAGRFFTVWATIWVIHDIVTSPSIFAIYYRGI